MNPKLINPCDDCLVQACCYVLKNYKLLYRQNVAVDIQIAGCNDFNEYRAISSHNGQDIFILQNIAQKYKSINRITMGNNRRVTLSKIRKRIVNYNVKLGNKRNKCSGVAQCAERLVVNQGVAGSNPAAGAKPFCERRILCLQIRDREICTKLSKEKVDIAQWFVEVQHLR